MKSLPQWMDKDEYRSILMDGPYVVGEVRHTMVGWSALFAGKCCARGLKCRTSAKIAVANARVRTLLPGRKIATDQDHMAVIRRLTRHERTT